jgi:hypothetical protein
MKTMKTMGILFCLAAVSAGAALLGRNSSAENAANLAGKPAIAPSWEPQTVEGETIHQ